MFLNKYSVKCRLWIVFVFLSIGSVHSQPEILWDLNYGGIYGLSVTSNYEDGCVVVGISNSIDPNIIWKILIMNIDSSGDILWTKKYGRNKITVGYCITKTSDLGYIIAGALVTDRGYDVYVLKVDQSGDSLWAKTYNLNKYDEAYSIVETEDKGFLLTGYCSKIVGLNHYNGSFLLKINQYGDSLWTYCDQVANYSVGNSAIETNGAYYMFTGYSADKDGNESLFVIKTTTFGDTLWYRTFGGSDRESGNMIKNTSDGGFIVIGETNSYGNGDFDYWLLKFDSNGDTVWTKCFGSSGEERGIAVCQTPDEGYMLVGRSNFYGRGGDELWIVRTNSLGDTLWTKAVGDIYDDIVWDIEYVGPNTYYITGYRYYEDNSKDVWLIKLKETTNSLFENHNIVSSTFRLHKNYPNPFNPSTTIEFTLPKPEFVTLKIYNILAEEITTVVNDKLQAGNHAYKFDGSNLASGVYLYRIKAGKFNKVKKMILIK